MACSRTILSRFHRNLPKSNIIFAQRTYKQTFITSAKFAVPNQNSIILTQNVFKLQGLNKIQISNKYSFSRSNRKLSQLAQSSPEESIRTVPVTFVVEGEEIAVDAEIGKSILDVAHDNEIDIEGACSGELACSTCHCFFKPEFFKQLPEMKGEEDDMLEMAWGLTETSRLGCQVMVEPYFEGAKIYVPEEDFE
mmetsp:Transcript_39167/g.51655  ORF Transcript_39167/g.51655 Transcript_39167/m.51655 type:complete len:194 (-) Transcript_39167:227-808(-)